MKLRNARYLARDFLDGLIQPGDAVVDATMGNGHDTLYLAQKVGESGRVWAFDVQQAALDATRRRLEDNGCADRVRLILDSHANMGAYAQENSVDCIVFNLGWLPGGDHTVFTHADSTIAAIEAGLKLLRKDGVMCVSIYYGGASGYEERDALLEYVRTIDPAQYTVLVTQFVNRAGDPPIPVFIHKAT